MVLGLEKCNSLCCVFILTPVCALIMNNEVVVLQPRIGTSPYLVYVAIIITFILAPPAPHVSTVFLDISIFPPPSYPSPISNRLLS